MNHIFCCDADALPMLYTGQLDAVVTSPPYYELREKGNDEQIGWEATPTLYVDALVRRFDAIRKCLKPSASVFVNLGDTTDGSGWLGLPWRFAWAMRDAGWKLRAEIVWHKPNAMPSGAQARRAPSPNHEQIFLFTTGDAEPVYDFIGGATPGTSTPLRLPRSVWTIPVESYRGSHFAAFPLELARRCIVLGSTQSQCSACGEPVRRQWTAERRPTRPGRSTKTAGLAAGTTGRRDSRRHVTDYKTTGWAPSCQCKAESVPSRILDPFAGHGTTALAALDEDREFVMVELDPENCRNMFERVRSQFPTASIWTQGFKL